MDQKNNRTGYVLRRVATEEHLARLSRFGDQPEAFFQNYGFEPLRADMDRPAACMDGNRPLFDRFDAILNGMSGLSRYQADPERNTGGAPQTAALRFLQIGDIILLPEKR
jgi:hypothetical protein